MDQAGSTSTAQEGRGAAGQQRAAGRSSSRGRQVDRFRVVAGPGRIGVVEQRSSRVLQFRRESSEHHLSGPSGPRNRPKITRDLRAVQSSNRASEPRDLAQQQGPAAPPQGNELGQVIGQQQAPLLRSRPAIAAAPRPPRGGDRFGRKVDDVHLRMVARWFVSKRLAARLQASAAQSSSRAD